MTKAPQSKVMRSSIHDLDDLSTVEVLCVASQLLKEGSMLPSLNKEERLKYIEYQEVVENFRVMWDKTAVIVNDSPTQRERSEFLDIDRKARSTGVDVIDYAMRTMNPQTQGEKL